MNVFIYYLLPHSGSTDTDEPDKLTFPRLTLPNNPDQRARVAQMRQSYSQPLSLHDFDVTPEKEGILLSYI